MSHSVMGLDIAKHVFHLYTIQAGGKIFRKMLKRQEVLVFFANYPSSLVGIEACGSSHYWARELIKLGHDARLLNARHVKAFVKGNKNDFNDAEAIFDAVSRPNARTIAVKTVEQQDIQLLHRLRQEATKRRTALVNQIRSLLSERGIVMGQTKCSLPNLPLALAPEVAGLGNYTCLLAFKDLLAAEAAPVGDNMEFGHCHRVFSLCRHVG
jgi:transposase